MAPLEANFYAFDKRDPQGQIISFTLLTRRDERVVASLYQTIVTFRKRQYDNRDWLASEFAYKRDRLSIFYSYEDSSEKQSMKRKAERRAANRLRSNTSAAVSEKHMEILDAAATLFAKKGYKATSVRDIGNQVGMLGGSLYHHIKSKELLFVQIHDAALEQAESEIRLAINGLSDPWEKLEAAARTLLCIQLDPKSITMPIMNDFRTVPNELRARLVQQRDKFELLFKELISALPLESDVDRQIFRLSLLTLLNNIDTWYNSNGKSPAVISQQVVSIFRGERSKTANKDH